MMSKQATTRAMEIKLAHSPDSDDAFMFYALATNKVRSGRAEVYARAGGY